MKNINNIYFIFLGALFLGACGGTSSDPLAKYDVKGQAPHQTPRETVSTLRSGKLEIVQGDISPGLVSQNFFIEEQAGQLRFEVVVRDPRITQIRVDISKFPQSPNSPSVQRTGDSALTGEFVLSWTPPRGHLPPGISSLPHSAAISVKVEDATLPELIGLMIEKELLFVVNKTQSVPKIIEFTDLKKGFEEGSLVPFRVVVEDPSAARTGIPPRLDFHDLNQSNTEAICVNMRNRILNQDPTKVVEKISSSKFEFNYLIDTRDLPNAFDRRGKETSEVDRVQMCFGMSARNSDNGISGEVRVQADGRYAVRVPEIIWSDNLATTVLPSKQVSELRFEILDPRGLGEVSLPEAQISALKKSMRSQIEILCEVTTPASSPNPKSKKSCLMKIEPECPPASQQQRPLESAVKLAIRLENKLGARTRASEFSRDFKVVAEEVNCPTSKESKARSEAKPMRPQESPKR